MAESSKKEFQLMAFNIQGKMLAKLIMRGVKSSSVSKFSVLDKNGAEMLNKLYNLITRQDSEEVAKRVTKDLVSVVTKIAVLYWNNILTVEEEGMIEELVKNEKDYVDAWLTVAKSGSADYSEIVDYMGACEKTFLGIIENRFSAKTAAKTRGVAAYLMQPEVYEFLFKHATGGAEGADATERDTFIAIMKTMSWTLGISIQEIAHMRAQSTRIAKLTEASKVIQKKVAAKIKQKHPDRVHLLPDGVPLFQEEALVVLDLLQRFILTESRDAHKADTLLQNIMIIVAKLVVTFTCDIFTEEDMPSFVKMVMLTREIITDFLKLSSDSTADVTALIEKHETCEGLLTDVMMKHFGGKTLDNIRSIFYYFKKPEIYVFFFKEMKNTSIREELLANFQTILDSVFGQYINFDIAKVTLHSEQA